MIRVGRIGAVVRWRCGVPMICTLVRWVGRMRCVMLPRLVMIRLYGRLWVPVRLKLVPVLGRIRRCRCRR